MRMKTKVCIVCGKKYIPNGGRQKRCSTCGVEHNRLLEREAGRIYRQKHRVVTQVGTIQDRVCQVCGKIYSPTGRCQKYCSTCKTKVQLATNVVRKRLYRAEHRTLPNTRQCDICGKKYRPFNSLHKYCSECGIEKRMEQSRLSARQSQLKRKCVKQPSTCKMCGKELVPSGHFIKYCSEACRTAGYKEAQAEGALRYYERNKQLPEYKQDARDRAKKHYEAYKHDAAYKAMKARNVKIYLDRHKHDPEFRDKATFRAMLYNKTRCKKDPAYKDLLQGQMAKARANKKLRLGSVPFFQAMAIASGVHRGEL